MLQMVLNNEVLMEKIHPNPIRIVNFGKVIWKCPLIG